MLHHLGRYLRPAMLICTGVLGMLALASPASADGGMPTSPAAAVIATAAPDAVVPPDTPCVSTTGATACFIALGDQLWVQDTVSDGHHASGFISVPGVVAFECPNFEGLGVWVICNTMADDIPEHALATLWAENKEGSNPLSTSEKIIVETT